MKKVFACILILALSAAMLTACNGGPGGGGDAIYESGTIRLIVPLGVGGTSDLVVRKYAAVAGRLFPDFNFIVVNMTGGDGFAGADYFADSSPDAANVFYIHYGGIYRHDIGRAYGTEDVVWDLYNIQSLATIDNRTWIVYVNIGTTLEDILDLARNGTLRMSGGNPLSDPHLAFGSLMVAEGGNVLVIPYDGGAMQRQALINDEVDVWIGTTQAGIEETYAGIMIPILAIADDTVTFAGPDGDIIVPSVVGGNRHPALSQDHPASIIPAGGLISVRRGAPQGWIDLQIEIANAVMSDPEFYGWMHENMLEFHFIFGEDAERYVADASALAMDAFRALRG